MKYHTIWIRLPRSFTLTIQKSFGLILPVYKKEIDWYAHKSHSKSNDGVHGRLVEGKDYLGDSDQ